MPPTASRRDGGTLKSSRKSKKSARDRNCDLDRRDSGSPSQNDNGDAQQAIRSSSSSNIPPKTSELELEGYHHRLSSSSSSRELVPPRSLKIFKNGEDEEPFLFPYKEDLSHARSWSAVLDMLGASMAMSTKSRGGSAGTGTEEGVVAGSGALLAFDVAKIFTTEGKQVLSLQHLDCCSEVVVCRSKESYRRAPYGALSTPSSSTADFCTGFNERPRVLRDNTISVKKSVFFDLPPPSPPTTADENNNPRDRSRVGKIFSEMDVVTHLEHASKSDGEGESPSKMEGPSNNHSLKYRPKSARASKIPRRIVSVASNINCDGGNGNGGGSPLPGSQRDLLVTAVQSNTTTRTPTPRSTCSAVAVSVPSVVGVGTATPPPPEGTRQTPDAKIWAPEKPVSLSALSSSSKRKAIREFVRPRLVTIVGHGRNPRKAIRFLLNKKTAMSYDRVLTDITASISPTWGAVRRVYTLNGAEVTTLEDFFGNDDIFLACPNDRVGVEDFELNYEECKAIQPYVKAKLVQKAGSSSRSAIALDSKSPLRKSIKTEVESSPCSPQVDMGAGTGTAAGVSSPHPKNRSLSLLPSQIMDKYEVGKIIGDGNFAVVRDCTDRKSRKRFALKVIDKSKFSGIGVPSPDQEIRILAGVTHPNIIVLYEHYDLSDEFYLVMELVEGGDLFDTIAEVEKFSEEDSKSMTRDVASALQYLHARDIVHRDVKPENLLIYFQADGCRRIKLGDFGLAQLVTGPIFIVCGTPTYVSPEILGETGYGLKVDIWALGVIVYVLLCGYPPFYSATGNQEELFSLILAGAFEFHEDAWADVSSGAKDIIQLMIESNPSSRLTAEQVLHHSWLAVPPVSQTTPKNLQKDKKRSSTRIITPHK